MAEEKKSFILYADLIHTVEMLDDEVAGRLLKIILQYVNDKNPVPEDLILKLAFEPIKRQLKRDLKGWENSKKIKHENGVLGNLKRWNSDLYKKVTSGKMTLDEAKKIAISRHGSHSDSGGSGSDR